MDRNLLTPFRLTVAERRLGVHAVHVSREGREPVEHRFRADDREHLYSVAKTFTAVAVGMARDEGLLELDDQVVRFFPHFAGRAGDGVEAVTVRHLLTMTSGLDYAWFSDQPVLVPDLAADILAAGLVAAPGTRFAYSGAGPYLLGRIIHAVSGTDLRDYLMPRLFDPLGIHNPQWSRCPAGHSMAEGGLSLTTGELAAFGRMLLQEGLVDGTRVISADYVRLMHTDMADSSSFGPDEESSAGYGFGVWGCTVPGAWRADGKYGQFCVILPQQRSCITITSHHEGINGDILRAAWHDILPALSS